VGHSFRWNLHGLTGFWVAPNTWRPVVEPEASETAYFNTVSIHQRVAQRFKDGLDLTANSVSLGVNCGKRAASRVMSSERIIGEFYAALPLGSGGKPHNASPNSIDDAWQLRRPPDVELRPSAQATVGDPDALQLAAAMSHVGRLINDGSIL
jgi:hypothetical protein